MSGEIVTSSRLAGNLKIDTDVVVVGSGTGGAIVAAELAEAGHEVVILEEGPHIPSDRYSAMRPSQSMRHLWRDGAMTIALGLGNTPAINVTMGRCVGGSSVVTGGVCFRVPHNVLQVWREERGLTDFTEEKLEPIYQHVEQRVHVEEVPETMRSEGTRRFARGAESLGIPMKPLRRNTRGCDGCGQCNFGCPHNAKLSVDVAYLPSALSCGTRIYADCLVDRIIIDGDRAVGVRGRVLNGRRGKPGGRLEVRAKRVVVACGAFHSPLLLRKSGIGRRSRQVGRNLTLHPAFRMMAVFDDPIRGWQGSLQSAYSDHFEHEGITLVGLFVPPGVLAATMPGFGPDYVRRAQSIPHLGMFGGLIHDEGGGIVHRGLGREPIVTYRMAPKDRATVPRVIRLMAEIFFAGGAREVIVPVLGQRPMNPDQLAKFDLEHLPGHRFECASQHPLGSCRMGASADSSVVDPLGRAWDVRDLYVADGSIVPTSLGVNPQLSIMTLATRIAWGMLGRL